MVTCGMGNLSQMAKKKKRTGTRPRVSLNKEKLAVNKSFE